MSVQDFAPPTRSCRSSDAFISKFPKGDAIPRAITPVNLFGQMCDIDSMTKVARKNNLVVVEDAG